MKLLNIISVALITTALIPSETMAAETPQNLGPDIIKFKMGDLYLKFEHLQHQKWCNNECFHCHKNNEWKIVNWDRDMAHQICIFCHDQKKKGPVECSECHGSSRLSHL